jgi:predicted nucleic acid-binding protein
MARPEVANILDTLLASGLVQCEDGGITLDALQRITSNKISFGDAYLVASAAHAKEELVSFDKGIAGFKEARLFPLNSLKPV